MRFASSDFRSLGRRFLYFWPVWLLLLAAHEGGHAVAARMQGLEVRRITVGAGPVIWRSQARQPKTVVRLVPVAGATRVKPAPGADSSASDRWSRWRRSILTLAGGVCATMLVALLLAGIIRGYERTTRRVFVLGRHVLADAIVLSLFNLLPVPPLDGGRALIDTLTAIRGSPFADETLFLLQLGGFALAIVPMTVWTRWTARIDAVAMRWGSSP